MHDYHRFLTIARAALGLGLNDKLPTAGVAPVVIEGWQVWVRPLTGQPGPRLGRWVHRRMQHRLMAHCLTCDQIMSAGRVHQHVCKGSTATRAALRTLSFPRPLGAVPLGE